LIHAYYNINLLLRVNFTLKDSASKQSHFIEAGRALLRPYLPSEVDEDTDQLIQGLRKTESNPGNNLMQAIIGLHNKNASKVAITCYNTILLWLKLVVNVEFQGSRDKTFML
jgi:hypothetical protein